MRRPRLLLAAVSALSLAACSSGGGAHSTSTTTTTTSTTTTTDLPPIGGARPVEMHVPPTYQQGTAVPLVLMLHGYSADADEEESYLGITAQADAHGFIYARANGTMDPTGNRFWNASNACCDLYDSGVDDSGYLSGVITEIEAQYTIDPKQVYLFGHSNGAFMSYRMACDHADQIAAIVSLAGAMPSDPTMCHASAPVSTLEIHGTADTEILYDGGSIQHVTPDTLVPYPAVTTTVSDWVTTDGCTTVPDTSAPNLDLDTTLAGAETTVTQYGSCKPGGYAELWTIAGGGHIPFLSPAFTPDAIQFLLDHPRP